MPVKLNSTGGGSVTLDTPSTASNYTVTLPAATSTLIDTTSTQTLTNKTLVASGSNTVEATSGPTSTQLAGMRNKIINGAMMIDQRNAGASVTPAAGGYCVDRWYAVADVGSKYSVQQTTTVPTGFANSLKFTSLSSYTVGATEVFGVWQPIEGFNAADLNFGSANAKTVTISFWVQSSLTGTFGGALQNSGFSRNYPFSYTINAANTWEQKTVTVAGDTTGTWVGATNGVGAYLTFSIGSGSSRSATANAWTGSLAFSATGATSVVGTNGATFYITGVQLEKGATATPFENRLYGTELALCQRYYARFNLLASTTARVGSTVFPVTMRASPTVAQTFDNGTGATYTPLLTVAGTALFQDTAHSIIATANVTASIEL